MHYHDRTSHTYDSVRMPNFLDWDTQPAAFKHYPHFYQRFSFDDLPEKDFWPLLGGITEEREHGDTRYSLRTVPSAGALFPFELYLQIRGIHGILEGVYHYEAESKSLVLLHPIQRDGIEPYLGLKKFTGIIFIISAPWFRSAWKYGKRSFRYCNLDSGHQLGAVEAACAATGRPFTALTEFDKRALAERLGMEDKEFVMLAALSGSEEEKEVKQLSLQLPHVLPTDYHESSPEILSAYVETSRENVSRPEESFTPYSKEGLVNAILERRSIRAFYRKEMEKAEFNQVMSIVTSPLSGLDSENIHVYAIVHPRVNGMQAGIYKNGELWKEGDFSVQAGYLCLEQRLGSDSGATLFLTGKSDDYQSLMIKAGAMGHRLYIEATRLKLGASGIGAFYDGQVQEFLETDDWILYALAFGR